MGFGDYINLNNAVATFGGPLGYLAVGGYERNEKPMGAIPNYQNPILNDLLGVGWGVHKHGADAGQPYQYKTGTGIFDDQTFGLDTFKGQVQDYARNPLPFSDMEQKARDLFASDDDYDESLERLRELAGLTIEGARTGYRTDTADIMRRATDVANQSYREAAAQTAEAYGGYLGGSDYQRQFLDESRQLGEGLGLFGANLDYEASEAAEGRKLQYAPYAGTYSTAPTAYRTAYADDQFNFGANYRAHEEAMRRRPLDVFNELSGLQQNNQPIVGGNPVGPDSGTAFLSTLANLVGGIG
jgi:hypothetical protein